MLQPPILSDEQVTLRPLQWQDLDALYAVASDPLIWEQHPNSNRYQRPVFENYFQGAMESGGAFLISNSLTGEVIGSSRYYDHEPDKKLLKIGELAEAVGEGVATIRYWTLEGLLKVSGYSPGKYQLYQPSQIEQAKQIRYLQNAKRLTLREIREELDKAA